MALLPNINVGAAPNDGTGSSIRDAFTIVNENFQLIEAFFPNSDVANLTANITSTGTSVFNIANVDVLNVNTLSSANTITFTSNIITNITSTGDSTFNTATFTGNLDADIINANVLITANATLTGNATLSGNLSSSNINNTNELVSANGSFTNLTSTDAQFTGNLIVNGTFNRFTSGVTIFEDRLKANGRFQANTITITSDANLEIDLLDAHTVVANLTAGNITVTLPNANIDYYRGLTYTFICYDEGGNPNRTLTVNVQPSAPNIWNSANTQTTFINLSAELGTHSKSFRTDETYWYTY